MGQTPTFSIAHGEVCRISTGGMLPEGTDSVVMIEHTEMLDDTTIEIYRSVAPGQHVVEVGEDFRRGQIILEAGQYLRPQETGLLAAFGQQTVRVFRRPKIAIISTGDEVVPIDSTPVPGQIRDVNSYSLSGQVLAAGGIPVRYGIVRDNYEALYATCRDALAGSDMILLSGGSSVGVRDFTIDVLDPTSRFTHPCARHLDQPRQADHSGQYAEQGGLGPARSCGIGHGRFQSRGSAVHRACGGIIPFAATGFQDSRPAEPQHRFGSGTHRFYPRAPHP